MNFGGTIRVNKCGLIFILAVGFLIIFYAYGGGSSSNSLNNDNVSSSAAVISKKISLKDLVSAAIDVAVKGGVEVVKVRKSAAVLDETIKGQTKEGVKDSATAGDYRSHRIMYYSLKKTFPLIKVISEEHSEIPDIQGDIPIASTSNPEVQLNFKGEEIVDADDVTVWIDPLDATKEYTENLLEYVTTMVGVAVKGKPVLGVIHRPFQDETYWAVLGHGHSPNLTPPSEKKSSDDSVFKIIVSRSHKGDVEKKTAEVLGPTVPIKLIDAAGAGYKVLEVVKGNADVYVHVTAIKKWDLCAGNGILVALGGKMTTVKGDLIDYSGHTEPMNDRGILAFVQESELVKKLGKMEIPEGKK